jgi:hypothetical protein
MRVDNRPRSETKYGRKTSRVIIVAMAQYDSVGLGDIDTEDSCVLEK